MFSSPQRLRGFLRETRGPSADTDRLYVRVLQHPRATCVCLNPELASHRLGSCRISVADRHQIGGFKFFVDPRMVLAPKTCSDDSDAKFLHLRSNPLPNPR